jgi:hypothetical protein
LNGLNTLYKYLCAITLTLLNFTLWPNVVVIL